MKKVSGDASSIETGLRDWIEQSNASGNTWLKKYKSNYDQKLKNCWYESSKGPAATANRDKSEDSLKQMAKNWEKSRDPQVSRHWNSSEASEKNYFWDDVQRVFEPVEFYDYSLTKNTNLGKITKKVGIKIKKSCKCYLVKRTRNPFSLIIIDSKNKLELKIDDIQGKSSSSI